jgi:hypothetical protein
MAYSIYEGSKYFLVQEIYNIDPKFFGVNAVEKGTKSAQIHVLRQCAYLFVCLDELKKWRGYESIF